MHRVYSIQGNGLEKKKISDANLKPVKRIILDIYLIRWQCRSCKKKCASYWTQNQWIKTKCECVLDGYMDNKNSWAHSFQRQTRWPSDASNSFSIFFAAQIVHADTPQSSSHFVCVKKWADVNSCMKYNKSKYWRNLCKIYAQMLMLMLMSAQHIENAKPNMSLLSCCNRIKFVENLLFHINVLKQK